MKIGLQLRELLINLLPHLIHIHEAADVMASVKSYLSERCVHRRVGREKGLEAGCDTDIGNDGAQILRFHNTPDDSLDLFHVSLGYTQPRAGGRLEVNHELARIRAREEGKSEQRVEQKAQRKDGHETCND